MRVQNAPISERLELLRLSVDQFFGYGSISRAIVDDNNIDPHQIGRDLGCFVIQGSISWGFLKDARGTELVFGNKPDKNTLNRMIKESKQAKK